MKLTPRQNEVFEKILLVRTDGARFDPQYRLGEKNVTIQVRSLKRFGLVELRGKGLIAIEQPAASARAAVDTSVAVSAMRSFLGG